MKVLMFEKRFWQAVASGDKLHTIRPHRKRPIVAGTELSLRGWAGKPYRSQQQVICEATCIRTLDVWIDAQGIWLEEQQRRIDDRAELDLFAVADGFDNWVEMLGFRHFAKFDHAASLIQWGVHPNFKTLGI